jgi:hypothetical protein
MLGVMVTFGVPVNVKFPVMFSGATEVLGVPSKANANAGEPALHVRLAQVHCCPGVATSMASVAPLATITALFAQLPPTTASSMPALIAVVPE